MIENLWTFVQLLWYTLEIIFLLRAGYLGMFTTCSSMTDFPRLFSNKASPLPDFYFIVFPSIWQESFSSVVFLQRKSTNWTIFSVTTNSALWISANANTKYWIPNRQIANTEYRNTSLYHILSIFLKNLLWYRHISNIQYWFGILTKVNQDSFILLVRLIK